MFAAFLGSFLYGLLLPGFFRRRLGGLLGCHDYLHLPGTMASYRKVTLPPAGTHCTANSSGPLRRMPTTAVGRSDWSRYSMPAGGLSVTTTSSAALEESFFTSSRTGVAPDPVLARTDRTTPTTTPFPAMAAGGVRRIGTAKGTASGKTI